MVYLSDLLAAMKTDPRRKWRKSELVELCGCLMSVTEAVARYRTANGFTEETDPNIRTLDQKIRLGQRSAINRVIATARVNGYIRKFGGRTGPNVRFQLNRQKLASNKSKKQAAKNMLGFGRDAVRRLVVDYNEPFRIGDIIDQLRDKVDVDHAMRLWKTAKATGRHLRKVTCREDKIRHIMCLAVLKHTQEIIGKVGGQVQKPSPEDRQVIISAVGITQLRKSLKARDMFY